MSTSESYEESRGSEKPLPAPWWWLSRMAPARGPLIVMYHGIGGPDGVPLERFEEQIDALSGLRRIVPLSEAVAALGTPAAHRLAAITFDDGYRDFAELAVPVLVRRGLHATVFVPAALLGDHNRWDTEIGVAPHRSILDGASLRSLDPQHVEVGGHGLTHCRLAGLPPEQLQAETSEARAILEETCGRPVRLFAYPYGQLDDIDLAAQQAVEQAGFEAACSTHFGRGSRTKERFRLRRVGVRPNDTLLEFQKRLVGAADWVAPKEILGAAHRRFRRRLARSANSSSE
jgi:peptidoglycan/xylan/chitin deacetylase (PgdA/CDA1 family)